jgi:hypothetical protein
MQQYGARAKRIEEAPVARRATGRWRPALGAAAALAACAWALYGHGKGKVAPPVTVALQASNGPVKIFSGWNYGVFFVMPDGTLWRWGRPEGPKFERATAPEQVGTNRDWAKVTVLNGPRVYALRTNGTIWEWGELPNGRFTNQPAQRNLERDWKDIAVTDRNRVALKRDGTMWAWAPAWGTVKFTRGMRYPQQVGTDRNWVKIVTAREGVFGLQKNGTLWYWGQTSKGAMQGPEQICRETNWIDLSEDRRGTVAGGQEYYLEFASSGLTPDRTNSAAALFRSVTWPLVVDGRRVDWLWQWRSPLAAPSDEGVGLALDPGAVSLMWGVDPGVDFKPTFRDRLKMLTDRQYDPPTARRITAPRTVLKLDQVGQ